MTDGIDTSGLGRTALATTTLVLLAGTAPAWGRTTERVSVSSSSEQGNSESGPFGVAISANGRYVAFYSNASNLVPGDTNDSNDIFVRDRKTGRTERVSISSSGKQADGDSAFPALSAD